MYTTNLERVLIVLEKKTFVEQLGASLSLSLSLFDILQPLWKSSITCSSDTTKVLEYPKEYFEYFYISWGQIQMHISIHLHMYSIVCIVYMFVVHTVLHFVFLSFYSRFLLSLSLLLLSKCVFVWIPVCLPIWRCKHANNKFGIVNKFETLKLFHSHKVLKVLHATTNTHPINLQYPTPPTTLDRAYILQTSLRTCPMRIILMSSQFVW